MKFTHMIAGLVALLAAASALAAPDYEPEPPSEHRLLQLLAPVALYPDTVLTHVLIAATYPLEVVQAERWADQNNHLQGQEAVNAAQDKPWDPSVIALVAFPDLLSRMSEDLPWTQELGEAFLADEQATLEAVQQLRQQARDNGTFDKMEHQQVIYRDREIIIEPARREVVYVPYYDSRVVYGNWRWSAHPPVYWPSPARYSGGFHWGFHAPVGDWFYFGGFHWGQRTVVISHNRPYYNYHHRRYGYHREVQTWHHDRSHRRNVRYHNSRVPARWRGSQPSSERRYSDHERQNVTRQLQHHRSRLDALKLNNNQRQRTVTREPQGVRANATHERARRNSVLNNRLRTSRSNEQAERPSRRLQTAPSPSRKKHDSHSVDRSRQRMIERSTSGRRYSNDRGNNTRASRLRRE